MVSEGPMCLKFPREPLTNEHDQAPFSSCMFNFCGLHSENLANGLSSILAILNALHLTFTVLSVRIYLVRRYALFMKALKSIPNRPR